MITPDDVRKIALSLPEAEENAHHGNPDFRVRNKIFATLPPGGEMAVIKAPLDYQEMLVATEPDTFSLGGWSHQGWTQINLAKIGEDHFRHVVTTAWKNVAPKALVKEFESS